MVIGGNNEISTPSKLFLDQCRTKCGDILLLPICKINQFNATCIFMSICNIVNMMTLIIINYVNMRDNHVTCNM